MITKDHIKYLKDSLEPNGDDYPYKELYEWHKEYLYLTLKQSGPFFNNLLKVEDLVWSSKSLADFKIRVDLLGWPFEAVDFAICYVWMCPDRIFSFDWRDLEKDTQSPLPSFSSERECTAWSIYNMRYKEISSQNLPILEVSDFMKTVL